MLTYLFHFHHILLSHESLLPPNPSLVSSGIITSPVPFGLIVISPSVFEMINTLPSKLSYLHSTGQLFYFDLSIATNPFDAVAELDTLATDPAVCAIRSVKYLPPITSTDCQSYHRQIVSLLYLLVFLQQWLNQVHRN